MAYHTLSFPIATINKMKEAYKNSLVKTPAGAVFSAKLPHTVITAYQSGKVLFQGKNPEIEIIRWSTEELPNNRTKVKKHEYTPLNTLFTANHIGSDESGTGDYFGPITVAATYLTKEQIPVLREMGIADSKKLTDSLISELATKLLELNIPYTSLTLHNEKYNQLQQNGWSQGKMKTLLHHHANTNLIKKIGLHKYEGILIDQFCEPYIYKRHLQSEKLTLPQKTFFMTKAEDFSIAVAAASIIARAKFIKEMDHLSEKLGVELLKGASKKVDQLAAEIIQTRGFDSLNKYAKVHFANTEKAKAYIL